MHAQHLRYPAPNQMGTLAPTQELKDLGITVSPRGGITRVVIANEETGTVVAQGEADCSLRDNFNRRVGVAIALGRAIDAGEITLEPQAR